MTSFQDSNDRTVSGATSQKAPGVKPVLLIAATVLLATLVASIWLYRDGTFFRIPAKFATRIRARLPLR